MSFLGKYIGEKVKRTEDARLIRGIGHYVDDIKLADTLHVAFLRSPYGHAKINSINADAAKSAPGVVAVYVGTDIQGKVGLIPCAAAAPDMNKPDYPVLALGKVAYVGQPVAAVVASDKYKARDAAELIEVDYEPLDAVIDIEAAARPDSPVIHPELGTNVAWVYNAGSGDVDAAFAQADKIVTQRIVHQRLIPNAMEPRGVLAQYFPGEQQLNVWSSTQIPHLLRTTLAAMLNVPENRLRVIAPEVGGGFGSKLNVYAEEALLGWIAMQLNKPVKWIESRRENMMATIHGRGQTGTVEVAVKNDGTLLGLRYNVIYDVGAYLQLLTPAIPTLTGLMLSGCYKIPAIQLHCTQVYTNKMATDAYRGAGRPEATYLVERIMDRVAGELGMDPVELRRKNFPKPEEFPFATAAGLTYDTGDYEKSLNKALEIVDYKKLREEQAKARAEGRLVGIGISTYVEICAVGPSVMLPCGGWDSATVRVEPSGKATVLTGVSPHGQGEETAFAQIVAEMLGIDLNDVLVVHGDTDRVQYGIGTFGSRGLAIGGTAVMVATERIVKKAKRLAAHMLQTDEEALTFEDGKFVGAPDDKSMTIQEIAFHAHQAHNIPADFEPGLVASYFFEPKNCTFPFGTHVCVSEVDKETGDVKIQRYVAVDDCGRQINPLLVQGQVHGGIAQGMAQALYEEAVYDESGQLITGELMDYAVPKAYQLPHFELDHTVTETDVNPLGAKGVGEAGTIGATPAVANSVIDALAPLGVKHVDLPLRPEKLWRLLNQ
ncbi:MAG TPA: glyceraldehyde dehydrogenase subunit alpha [Blastocatellia bacterium]|nr:glyceraldehyde dehydrogenase subunit alpha [Blastocatellia bacterium]HMV87983.1 glyceraldehyde dehydrogenase subunit alpha [Blastocatellia bacterium]HMY74518.1 glyceraldehyde dehydrogenase subunit alpha [Blastocatellia bacterium]HMZ22903.1 glyceraldehyde dehydrogenase subunit alpha [Blastocatellia bacterium]HNG34847.1 glyceraldehyde dehydrogenase subunit alpha [Blastocatellia bacterium]